MADIVERLRGEAGDLDMQMPYIAKMVSQAADEIEALRAENAGLRAVNDKLDQEITDAILLRERLTAAEAVCIGLDTNYAFTAGVMDDLDRWCELAGR